MSKRSTALQTSPSDVADPCVAPGFAALLRERTSLVHREAERAGFIADLIRGKATRAGYALFLRNLIPVYDALETALDDAIAGASSHDGVAAVLSPFTDCRLRRREALRADVQAISGSSWQADLPVLPETDAYAGAVQAASKRDCLVAHAYARYLGDLSGGQILKPVLARNIGLTAAELNFYDFPAIADLSAPKLAMRTALDRVAVDGPDAEAIVAEATAAFRHNISLSLAVQAAAG